MNYICIIYEIYLYNLNVRSCFIGYRSPSLPPVLFYNSPERTLNVKKKEKDL